MHRNTIALLGCWWPCMLDQVVATVWAEPMRRLHLCTAIRAETHVVKMVLLLDLLSLHAVVDIHPARGWYRRRRFPLCGSCEYNVVVSAMKIILDTHGRVGHGIRVHEVRITVVRLSAVLEGRARRSPLRNLATEFGGLGSLAREPHVWEAVIPGIVILALQECIPHCDFAEVIKYRGPTSVHRCCCEPARRTNSANLPAPD
mmetsp:Transcript_10033/g.26660  ORF Transcript_10033/g.26660 Transcript_10033/m.26660 type:complete len:202 (+) Transcript_10033:253-858(+)